MSSNDKILTVQINNYINVNNESSSDNSDNNNDINCIICLEKIEPEDAINACNCSNPCHIECLLTWREYKHISECEICKVEYNIPHNILLEYLPQIENIKRIRQQRRRESIVEYINNEDNNELQTRRQINANYKKFKEFLCSCAILCCLVILFLCGLLLFTNNNI